MAVNTSVLKIFAPAMRRQLMEGVSRKLDLLINTKTPDTLTTYAKQIENLREQQDKNRDQLIEKVAYTWFNRLCALRYLDAKGWHPFACKVLMPAEQGENQPELLKLMRSGSLPAELKKFIDEQRLNQILDNQIPTSSQGGDPQAEVYRELVLAACRSYHHLLPDLFEALDDATELLLPDDLLTENSIAGNFRKEILDEDCEDVEIIGWLYQFYISEKKEEIRNALNKKNKKVVSEDIPAFTQLFTPKWIVKYLVENSLGRLWMLNNPKSNLIKKMEHFVPPEIPETDFLKINTPEEIQICDPACGSGHILIYCFDLLFSIYEEEGYQEDIIPELILKNNLYGIEIDKRAADLSYFSLIIKAREKQRNFFSKPVEPRICALENIKFNNNQIKQYVDEVGIDLFTSTFQTALRQFEECENFGSLIEPVLKNPHEILEILIKKNISSNLFLNTTHNLVLKLINQSDFLQKKYHIVITNPPYMGNNGFNSNLSEFAKKVYPLSKLNLFAMFLERSANLTLKSGYFSMINMQVWMFIARYEKLRSKLLSNFKFLTMAHIGTRGFDSIGGEIVSTTAFVFQNSHNIEHKGEFLRLVDGMSENEKSDMTKEAIKNKNCEWFYKISSNDFLKIPGYPIAYWVSDKLYNNFQTYPNLTKFIDTREGLITGNNDLFMRYWHEVNFEKIGFNYKNIEDTSNGTHTWFPYLKGGSFRRWYGNFEYIVNWHKNGELLKNFKDADTGRIRSHNYNGEFAFKKGFTWSGISGGFAVRSVSCGFKFDAKGPMGFSKNPEQLLPILGQLNSKVSTAILKILAPNLDFKLGNILNLPFKRDISKFENSTIERLIKISKSDWDSYETSWDFCDLPLLKIKKDSQKLTETYDSLRKIWQLNTDEMLELEESNNKVFIEAYGLQDELSPNISINEISLISNPRNRYREKIIQEFQEDKLKSDTLKEFISYSVGCMFGRYSLEEPGLIIANQGENLEDFLKRFPNPLFKPDDDNIIPIFNLDWFKDDITARFKKFLRITFGDDNFEENLRFIETSIGKDIRKYFLNDFYKDHIQTYKKRPIYWMVQSPKAGFACLIYLHRYTPETLLQVLNDYFRPYLQKLEARLTSLDLNQVKDSLSKREQIAARKEADRINKVIKECQDWEKEALLPLAQQRIKLNLNDGVKVNYSKLQKVLAKFQA